MALLDVVQISSSPLLALSAGIGLLQEVPSPVLASAIARLSSDEQLVLTMSYLENLSAFDTALVLDMQISDVLRLHASALESLRKTV